MTIFGAIKSVNKAVAAAKEKQSQALNYNAPGYMGQEGRGGRSVVQGAIRSGIMPGVYGAAAGGLAPAVLAPGGPAETAAAVGGAGVSYEGLQRTGDFAKDTLNRWGSPSDWFGGSKGSDGDSGGPSGESEWDKLNRELQTSRYGGAFDGNGNPISSSYGVYRPGYTDNVQRGYADMVREGTSSGLSNWGRAAYDRSRQDQTYAVDDARKQAMGDAAGNMNTLAMQGGLESGAAENMLRQGQRSGNQARTDIYRQGSMDRMGIDVSDAARKDEMRTKGLGGQMDTARYDADVQNINVTNALADRDKANQWGRDNLTMRGQLAGAKAVSDAMKNNSNTNTGLFGDMSVGGMNPLSGNMGENATWGAVNPLLASPGVRKTANNLWKSVSGGGGDISLPW